jgi:hypothetical protein
LIAAGLFETAGTITAQNIAAWSGSAWSPLGGGLGDKTAALAVYQGDLYAGGDFTSAGGATARHIARWDGQSWHDVAGGMSAGPWPMVTSLTVHENHLVAGGWFERAGGVDANHIALWDGANWSAPGAGVDNFVWSVASYRGLIIAAGDFLSAGTGEAARVAAWDGLGWQPLGAGVQDFARSLYAFGGGLYVGGQFLQAGQQPSYYIARWDQAGGSAVEESPGGRPGAGGAGFDLRVTTIAWDAGGIELAFELPDAGAAVLDVVDLQGRRVALLRAGAMAAGPHAVVWGGRDGRGRPVGSGVYFARLRVGGEQAVRRLVVAR